jgi:hypothetical protein
MMKKRIISAIVLLPVVFVLGCAEMPDLNLTKPSSGNPEIVRAAQLGSDWEMRQMRVEVEADEEISILLKLADGDRVDGYFYLEKGDDIDFRIAGNSLIYARAQGVTAAGEVDSDRFAFVASQAQGSTYTLTFHNTAADDSALRKVAVFLEIIYPAGGSIFIPVESD